MKKAPIAAAFAVGATMIGAGVADAGTPTDSVTIEFEFTGGDDALAAATAVEFELFEDGVDVSALCSTGAPAGSASSATVTATCAGLSPGDFTLGATAVDGYSASNAGCTSSGGLIDDDKAIDLPGASFTHIAGQTHVCTVQFAPPPNVSIDVVVDGGTAVPSDFEIEIYESVDAAPIATGIDPADTTCATGSADAAECAVIALAPGEYVLGAVDVSGYELGSVSCGTDFIAVKPFDEALATFQHGEFGVDSACTITMSFVTQTVTADIEVINDDDGTAVGADFTIEFFDTDGNLVASGVDPEPGVGNASLQLELPIGEYRVGADGPDGYELSATIVEIAIDPGDDLDELTKPIDGDDATFNLSETLSASAVITADDQAPDATTTTVPDTMPPATTTPPAPPTTIEPTAVLPATGSTTSGLVTVALAMLLMGGGAVLATRRS